MTAKDIVAYMCKTFALTDIDWSRQMLFAKKLLTKYNGSEIKYAIDYYKEKGKDVYSLGFLMYGSNMKKPISIINSSFTSNGENGMVEFYDDRTGGSAGELVEQDVLTIENNKIKLNNSKYVVSGISKDTINNINIAFRNNELLSEKLQLYDDECKESENIKIIEK